MATKAVLTISSKNYGAWALRGWFQNFLSKHRSCLLWLYYIQELAWN